MRNGRLIRNSKLTFKNKELRVEVYYNLIKFLNKKFKIPHIYKKKIYNLNNFVLFKPFKKEFKGCSILTLRRRAFYSLFQLSRFDTKKLISERTLIGIRSAVW